MGYEAAGFQVVERRGRMMRIDQETKFITLIGDPLKQSFAARMQNAAYEAAGLNVIYFYTEAGQEHLKQIIDGVRYMTPFIGCAVTKPNKVDVLEYLDELDPLCQKMGACNTVVKKDGKLIGYNTDGMGFYRSLKNDLGFEIGGRSFFCFGAGGAGRAICSVLAHYGAKQIWISDLFSKNTKELVDSINWNFAPVAKEAAFQDFSMVGGCDMVINASGIGMGKSIDETPLLAEHIREGQLYFDACYNPKKTVFLKNAEEKGCQIMNGLGMSLYQGAEQIELWTGEKAPIDEMRIELQKIMAGE